ncbi:MAG: succinate dehydrogenase, cytochrome b556 subunit [Mariprofundaceae bacterium]
MQASHQAAQDAGGQKPRPLSPHVSVYRWRAPMLASFAHRISGIVLVLFIPVYICLLSGLTATADDFSRMLQAMHSPFGRLFLCLLGTVLIYHLINGIRFLLLDAGIFETRDGMRWAARLCLGTGVIAALILAVYLW